MIKIMDLHQKKLKINQIPNIDYIYVYSAAKVRLHSFCEHIPSRFNIPIPIESLFYISIQNTHSHIQFAFDLLHVVPNNVVGFHQFFPFIVIY